MYEFLNKHVINQDVTEYSNTLSINHINQAAGFEIFNFLDKNQRATAIGENSDFLQLFMILAEAIYLEKKNAFGSYIMAVDMDGNRLFLKEFNKSDKQQFKYSYVTLLHFIKELPPEIKPETFSFFCEINRVDVKEPRFEPEAKKIIRVLKEKNKESWLEIIENKYDFLKTDLYVYSLQKLYSWGFQIISPDGRLRPDYNFVRPVRPKPRGVNRR